MRARAKRRVFLFFLFIFCVVPFVSPVFAENYIKMRPAEDILEDLREGKDVFITEAIIQGDLDFTNLSYEEFPNKTRVVHVRSKISIRDSEITGEIKAYDRNTSTGVITRVVFYESIDFFNTSVSGYTSFYNAKFINDAGFSNTKFSHIATFTEAVFTYSPKGFLANFAGARFFQRADFERAKFYRRASFFEAEFLSTAYFNDVIFTEIVTFSEAQFSDPTEFNKVQFLENVDFGRTQFSEVSFISTEFNGYALFIRSQFSEKAIFLGTKFDASGNFNFVIFSEITEFIQAHFSDQAWFIGTEFLNLVTFHDVQFDRRVYFVESRFYNESYFIRAEFKEIALFTRANFSGPAHFLSAVFHSIADFRDTHFQHVSFSGLPSAIFRDMADFRRSWFDSASFRGARFSHVDFSGAHFTSFLFLEDTVYSSMKLDWKEVAQVIQPSDDPEVFRSLEENFKSLKRLDYANGAFYQRKIAERKRKSQTVQDLEMIFLDWTCGYGVRPQNVVIVSAILILIFSLAYLPSDAMVRSPSTTEQGKLAIRLKELPLESSQQEEDGKKIKKPRPLLDRFLQALSFSFTVFTKIGFGKTYGKSKVRRYLIVEWFLGLAMISLLLYTLSQTIPLFQAILKGVLI